MGIKLAIGKVSTGTIVERFLKSNKVDRTLVVDHYEPGGTDFGGRPWGYHFYFQFSSFTELKENDEVEFKIIDLLSSKDFYQCEIIKVLDEKRYEVPEWLKEGSTVYIYYIELYTYKVLHVNHYSGNVLVMANVATKWSNKKTLYVKDLYGTAEAAEKRYRELEY